MTSAVYAMVQTQEMGGRELKAYVRSEGLSFPLNDDKPVKQRILQQGQIRQLICSPWAGIMLWMNDVETYFLSTDNSDY